MPYMFPQQRVTQGQSWTQSPQERIIGAALVSSGTSNSAGGANRIYTFLKKRYGANYALQVFRDSSFGPYMINKRGTGLIWN